MTIIGNEKEEEDWDTMMEGKVNENEEGKESERDNYRESEREKEGEGSLSSRGERGKEDRLYSFFN